MNTINVVEVENLSVRLQGRVILDQVTFSIQSEKFTGLIGPNGAGKTTLLRVLLGVVKPTAGNVRVFGHNPGQSHNLIGYVPQTSRFDTRFPVSVYDVVMMGLYGKIGLGRFPGKNDKRSVDEALELVGIQNLATKRFGALSGGEQQKTLIARALCAKPRLIMMDEPTTGVDAPSQDRFYEMLKGLIRSHNMSILLVSHDVGVITSLVDDLICLNQKVFCHGPSPRVLQDGIIGQAYGCETELLMHSHEVPHRLVHHHDKADNADG